MDNINAINNFFYFSLNYRSDYYDGKYMPTFLFQIDWTCSKEHIINKWFRLLDNDPYGRINRFYAELDGYNRRLLLEWVEKNYDCKSEI